MNIYLFLGAVITVSTLHSSNFPESVEAEGPSAPPNTPRSDYLDTDDMAPDTDFLSPDIPHDLGTSTGEASPKPRLRRQQSGRISKGTGLRDLEEDRMLQDWDFNPSPRARQRANTY